MSNRLAAATSPYLQQHRDNPVDWWEWGEDAFAEAKRRDVPVLLSVGYAACHWCHVMAHESFEDGATAAAMNELFVNIKVDREERPDVDAAYMRATQALTGHGGWPMTVFLTPQGRPFYAGTYFPPEPRHGMPAFRQVLEAIATTWREQRDQVEGAGARIALALREQSPAQAAAPPEDAVLAAAVRTLAAEEDREHGGFGQAPKFPPSAVLEFLLRHAARRRMAAMKPDADGTGQLAEEMAGRALTAMARSGMYDQLAGGFARYAVDRAWVVPHFEKMLYDNAQLARVYLHWWRLTGDPTGARIAEETCDWLLRELGTPAGGLASSLDADTEGVEGLTYVWTPAELAEALPDGAADWAAELLGVTEQGTFEHGASTLQLTRDPWSDPDEAERWRSLRATLLERRSRRPQPARDDKVITAWNGLAIAALAETGALRRRPDLITAAERIADYLLERHQRAPDRLLRVSRDGVPGSAVGVLEDYGDLAEGLVTLHGVTGGAGWLAAAGHLLDGVLARFADGRGGFYDAGADEHDPALIEMGRALDPLEGPHPSGWTAAAGALLSYGALTGSAAHRSAAEQALGLVGQVAQHAPRAIGWGLAVAEAALDGPREVAVVGGSPAARAELLNRALAGTAPGLVISAGEPDAPGVPLLADRPLVDGAPAAYVCQGFTCRAPTADPDVLTLALGGGPAVGDPAAGG